VEEFTNQIGIPHIVVKPESVNLREDWTDSGMIRKLNLI